MCKVVEISTSRKTTHDLPITLETEIGMGPLCNIISGLKTGDLEARAYGGDLGKSI